MFKIENGRECFYQWDLNQRLIVQDETITEVHFSNVCSTGALVCKVYELNGARYVSVPNILLQEHWTINVYAWSSNYVKHSDSFLIVKRDKPQDYMYEETEIMRWEDLEKRIDEIEANGVSQEVLGAALDSYFKENPIQSGATPEQVEQLNQNTADIEKVEKDLIKYINQYDGYLENIYNNYAKKTDIPDTSGFLTSVPEEYINETELAAKGYQTQEQVVALIPSLEGYAKMDDIPDVSKYQTQEQVSALIDTAIASLTDADEVSY